MYGIEPRFADSAVCGLVTTVGKNKKTKADEERILERKREIQNINGNGMKRKIIN
jgi:hypothetical protein